MKGVVEPVVPVTDIDSTTCLLGARVEPSPNLLNVDESVFWRERARRYEAGSMVLSVLALVCCGAFVLLLVVDRALLLFGMPVLALSPVLVAGSWWCARNARDAYDFAFWSLSVFVEER